jgi:FKBP-type peptidyl-prolyl cis-trans isomerase SlyD
MITQRVGHNKYVEFTYQITDETGEMIETVNLPVGYVYGGTQQMFERVESAINGMMEGESASVQLPAGEAYGEHEPSLIFTDDLKNVPPQFRHIGAQVEMQNENGETRAFVVTSMDDATMTLDGNHPLAGKAVIFNIKIESIRDATADEIYNETRKPGQKLH